MSKGRESPTYTGKGSRISPYQLLDLVQFLAGIVSLVVSLALVIQNWLRGPDTRLLIFAMIVMLTMSIMLIVMLLKLRRLAWVRLHVFADEFQQYVQTVLDGHHDLTRQSASEKLTHTEIQDRFRLVCQQCVDSIARTLTSSTVKQVSVCIKYFPNDQTINARDIDVEDYELRTLCRSYNSSPERLLHASTRIGDNTDFLMILKERKPYFRARDLHRLDNYLRKTKAEPYRNSNPRWDTFYRGTIVVPIGRLNSPLETEQGVSRADLLGFLCADSLSPSAFYDADLDAYTRLMQAFAAVLYPYFDRVQRYLRKTDPHRR